MPVGGRALPGVRALCQGPARRGPAAWGRPGRPRPLPLGQARRRPLRQPGCQDSHGDPAGAPRGVGDPGSDGHSLRGRLGGQGPFAVAAGHRGSRRTEWERPPSKVAPWAVTSPPGDHLTQHHGQGKTPRGAQATASPRPALSPSWRAGQARSDQVFEGRGQGDAGGARGAGEGRRGLLSRLSTPEQPLASGSSETRNAREPGQALAVCPPLQAGCPPAAPLGPYLEKHGKGEQAPGWSSGLVSCLSCCRWQVSSRNAGAGWPPKDTFTPVSWLGGLDETRPGRGRSDGGGGWGRETHGRTLWTVRDACETRFNQN